MSNDSTIGGRAIAELNLVDGKIVVADGRSRNIEGVLKRPGVVEEYAEYVPPGMKPESVADIYAGKSIQTGGSPGPYMMYALGCRIRRSARSRAYTRNPGAAHRRRIRRWASAQHPYRPQPIYGRHGVKHRIGSA